MRFTAELRQETAQGGVTSLMVTSGGTYWIWWESWLLPGHDPGQTPGTIQACHHDLEREQGQMGRQVIVCRTVPRWYVWKTVTHVMVEIFKNFLNIHHEVIFRMEIAT